MVVQRQVASEQAQYRAPEIIDLVGRLPEAHPEWKEVRALGEIERIVVHYDDQWRPNYPYDALGRYEGQARYHIGRVWGWSAKKPIYGFGLMYHYKVDGGGRIFRTQPEELVTWHANGWNRGGLAVCCDCGASQMPTSVQLEALRRLLVHLCYHGPTSRLGGETCGGTARGWRPATERSARDRSCRMCRGLEEGGGEGRRRTKEIRR